MSPSPFADRDNDELICQPSGGRPDDGPVSWSAMADDDRCTVPPAGWWCSREPGHDGPCAARPVGEPATHFAPGCTCDQGGENTRCPHHGYEAVIRRLQSEVEHLRTMDIASTRSLEATVAARDRLRAEVDKLTRDRDSWRLVAERIGRKLKAARAERASSPPTTKGHSLPDSRALSDQGACPLCGEPRAQHVPGPPDPPGPGAACLLSGPVRRVPHRRDQPDHWARLTEACVEGGFRDAQETEVVSLWAHGEIGRLRAENERLREAIVLHARTLDDRALGHPEHNERDRDSIDNDLYNLTRRIDPAWWDERVPGMARSPLSSDETEQTK